MSKRVLITGAAGFVGSHALKYFLEKTDWEFVALCRLNHSGNLQRLKDLDLSRIKFVYHDLKFSINDDVRDEIGVVDYIIHFAANSHVDRSIDYPKEFFEDNVMGTVNLLEYARLNYKTNKNPDKPPVRFLNFSTDEVFGPAPEDYNYKEDDRFRPSNPYSGSKAAQICAGHSYYVTYDMDIISTYTMNIYGTGQKTEKLIPKAIKLAKERKPMPVFAELEGEELVGVGSRHWLIAEDVASAVLFILENGEKGEHYNVVGSTEKTNEEVVRIINKELGLEPLIEFVDFHKSRPGHDRRYGLDGTKLKKLGWTPSVSFEDGIKMVIESER